MQFHYLGYTQNGMSWEAPHCPLCHYYYPKMEDLLKHFHDLHSYGREWFHVQAEDPRAYGLKINLLVDDPMVAGAMLGKSIKPEDKHE